MKAIPIQRVTVALLLSSVFAASSSFAQSGVPNSVNAHDGQHYDSTTSPGTPGARIDRDSSNAFGPYAKYLINVGASREAALKAAHDVDERQRNPQAIVIVDEPTANQPGPYAKYLMHIGLKQDEAMAAARNIDKRQEVIANNADRSTQGGHIANR